MSLAPGWMAGPYELLSTLGSGGMGTVYLARDTRLDRRVALKVLHDTPDGSARARVLHEARAASALNHPNICHIYDVGEQDGRPWIAMEYVDGRPLDVAIPAGGLGPDEGLRIGIQIADALAQAHARGIVHRDLKTANVVCDRDGRARILDFGIAARLPQEVAEQATRSQSLAVEDGTLTGTLPYMAPEILKGAPADERSDLWALGVILHEMLSGGRPFRGDTSFALASSIIEQPPRPLPPSIPQAVAATVSRLLAKNPGDRYRTAAETRAALEALRAGTPPAARRPKPVRALWIATAAALLTAAAWFAWMWSAAPDALRLSQQRLLSVSGRAERSPALSPDGSRLAFVAADADGVPQIFVRQLAADKAVQVTSADAPASRPRWTPSGDQIIYSAGQGIWRVPSLGGEPTRLIERGTNPNISRDGSRIVYERDRQIWTASADGSNPGRVAGVRKYYSVPFGPAFSPDGQWIAYFRPDKGPNGDLWVVPAGGGTPRQLTHDLREGGWPVWTADGDWIVFSSARAGSRTLWQVPVDGGDPIPLTTGAGEDNEPDLSVDGSRLVYSNVRHSWELRIRNLLTGDERALLERRSELLFPLFSPDGRHVTFFGRADYAVAIWTMAADGAGLRQLTAGRELNHMPRWGHDGSHILFYQAAPETSFRRIPAVGGASTEFRKWAWEEQNAAFFDPTGRFIAYTRQPPLGSPPERRPALVIQDVESGRERELAGQPFWMGRWSPDGREVAVYRSDGNRWNVWRCEIQRGTCEIVTEGRIPVWSGDGLRIYVMRGPAEAAEVWSVDRDGGNARFEVSLGAFRSIDRYFDVSRDGLLVWAPWRPGEHEVWTATVR